MTVIDKVSPLRFLPVRQLYARIKFCFQKIEIEFFRLPSVIRSRSAHASLIYPRFNFLRFGVFTQVYH